MPAVLILQTPGGQTVAAQPAGGGNGKSGEHHRPATAAEIALWQPGGQAIKTTAQHADDKKAGIA